MPRRSHVGSLIARLNKEIRRLRLPNGFCSSFDSTHTGNNKTHPWT